MKKLLIALLAFSSFAAAKPVEFVCHSSVLTRDNVQISDIEPDHFEINFDPATEQGKVLVNNAEGDITGEIDYPAVVLNSKNNHVKWTVLSDKTEIFVVQEIVGSKNVRFYKDCK